MTRNYIYGNVENYVLTTFFCCLECAPKCRVINMTWITRCSPGMCAAIDSSGKCQGGKCLTVVYLHLGGQVPKMLKNVRPGRKEDTAAVFLASSTV